ncbi:carbohydrate kinase family protein [candidate division WWE3 bacterium]|uniref:Carbohydrate kinase family protein n=1 Tax=candidate division WWE3 bacterium TaxID=2053526 RepID=A0A7X9E769_UNCKA|nr:carbohydrate kinase family protein [candidate division WWE3 bacterium]
MIKSIDILTIGDCGIDLTMYISKADEVKISDTEKPEICFIHGSKIPVEQFETSIAGNALNVAVGCNYLGLQASMYSEIGDDPNSQRIINELNIQNIDTSYCVRNPGTPTDVHSIIVYNGERTIFSYHGKRIYQIRNWPKPKLLYYTSIGKGFEPFQKELIKYIKSNIGIGVVFNPGTYQMKSGIETLKQFLEVTDILILNMEETLKITGEKPLAQMHINLHKMGVKMSVITDGDKGVSAFDGENLVSVNSYTDGNQVVDKTGAGDAFSSGFVSAIFHKKALKEALAWGVVNASGEITKESVGTGLYTKEKMEEVVSKLI